MKLGLSGHHWCELVRSYHFPSICGIDDMNGSQQNDGVSDDMFLLFSPA